MKVLILGASGIVGQHMRLCVPAGVEPIWVRREADPITQDLDSAGPEGFDVVVNLWGNSNVDAVEKDPMQSYEANRLMPKKLAILCAANGRKFIQVSTQAVYQSPGNNMDQPNAYGRQKRAAEISVLANGGIVVRLTFVLGIRPLPHVGRKNPLETMLEGQSPQVADRYFSPLFAWDAAELLWDAVLMAKPGDIRQLGQPIRTTRFDIARLVNPDVTSCSHDDFPGLAPRAKDTTFQNASYLRGLEQIHEIVERAKMEDRAIELALFFGITLEAAKAKLGQGFGALHNAVAEDFRRANPQGDVELLNWYRTTEAYIWELSAYHDDPGFNYTGQCKGIVERLKAEPGCSIVLALGDGIGDLSMALKEAGFDAVYHDLSGSRTADYAAFRRWRKMGDYRDPSRDPKTFAEFRDQRNAANGTFSTDLSYGWTFPTGHNYDAICSLDFLEHVPNVEDWVRAIFAALKPGGLFCAQNAFACGSGPDGSIPMHLAVNDRFERDWDPLLAAVGFEQISSNWYRRPS